MNSSNKKKPFAIALLRGATIDIYVPALSGSVYTLQFLPDVYSEMEILNIDRATKQLTEFFFLNKIPQSEFILIVQSPLFRKEFAIAPQSQLEALITNYLDYVPFDNVISKRVKTERGVMVVATNGGLIQDIKKMFDEAASTILCITSTEGLTVVPKGGLSVLTQASAENLLKNVSLLKQESFSLAPARSIDGFEIVGVDEAPKEKSILPLLIPVFVILLIILAYVYTKSQAPTPPVAPKKITITPTP